jgi:methylenetetrahydrofolate--tRNA-(uracil-5-)-methyltransferase
MDKSDIITVIGAGLAGCEAAWQLAQRGISVEVLEMRPERMTPAHTTSLCAELVCSNSLRSDDRERSAVGLLHEELRRLDSLIMSVADQLRLPAGGALAVDREGFAREVTRRLSEHPNIRLIRTEALTPNPEGWTLIASGPLTSPSLVQWIQENVPVGTLAFHDAIAPIATLESIDFRTAWRQSRYDKGNGQDYINCPMDLEQYETFIDGLRAADIVAYKSFEEKLSFFDGCLPIEEMARRGRETPRFGPMKPVGLRNPHNDNRTPHAVVQLRQDNQSGTLWNMVGFQTKLTWPDQKRLFRTIPGLEQAEFVRLGAMHRNTFINAPRVLNRFLQLKNHPRILFAGQITGVEGYVESTACGLLAGTFLAELCHDRHPVLPPPTTAHGALLAYITHEADATHFQPMNVHFGLFPPLEEWTAKKIRKSRMSARALTHLEAWMNPDPDANQAEMNVSSGHPAGR